MPFITPSPTISPHRKSTQLRHHSCPVAQGQKFCSDCGASVKLTVPAGDNRQRAVCSSCQTVHYENPRPIVAVVALSKDEKQVLLAKRAIPPIGTWTIPGGFVELGETTTQAAIREAMEETGGLVGDLRLMAVYNLLVAGQVQFVYAATMLEDKLEAGIESQQVGMFSWDSIPWQQLSFTTVKWALDHRLDMKKNGSWSVQTRDK